MTQYWDIYKQQLAISILLSAITGDIWNMHPQLRWQHLEPEKWEIFSKIEILSKMEIFSKIEIFSKMEIFINDLGERRVWVSWQPWTQQLVVYTVYISGAASHLPAATVNAAISNMQHCGNLPSRDATVEVETVLLSNTRGRERSTSMASFSSRLLFSDKSYFTLSLHLNKAK